MYQDPAEVTIFTRKACAPTVEERHRRKGKLKLAMFVYASTSANWRFAIVNASLRNIQCGIERQNGQERETNGVEREDAKPDV